MSRKKMERKLLCLGSCCKNFNKLVTFPGVCKLDEFLLAGASFWSLLMFLCYRLHKERLRPENSSSSCLSLDQVAWFSLWKLFCPCLENPTEISRKWGHFVGQVPTGMRMRGEPDRFYFYKVPPSHCCHCHSLLFDSKGKYDHGCDSWAQSSLPAFPHSSGFMPLT